MNHRRSTFVRGLRWFALLLAAVAATAGYLGVERRFNILEPDQIINLDDFPGISGIAYWPGPGTLIGVGGNQQIAEISLKGHILRKRAYPEYALKDVALVPHAESAVAIDERGNRLLTFGLADFSLISEKNIAEKPSFAWSNSKQYEGVALIGDPPRLVLSNEYPPVLAFFDAASEKIERASLLGSRSISSVIAGPQGELLLVSREDGLMLLDAQGNVVGDGWRPVSYQFIEGAALVPNLGLIICADRAPGKLLVFSSIKNWQDLLNVFKNKR
jgi:hypothetical protein